MAIKRMFRLEILEGEENILISKYAKHMTAGINVFLDGTRCGVVELDQDDVITLISSLHHAHPLKLFCKQFKYAEPFNLQNVKSLDRHSIGAVKEKLDIDPTPL